MAELLRDFKLAAESAARKVVQTEPGPVATALKSIVAAQGPEIYRDIPQLASQLRDQGIPENLIKQVELTVCGSSLERYFEQLANGLSAIDINNIILTAENAGLSSKAARKTVSDILFSLNVPQLAQDLQPLEPEQQPEAGTLYIPPSAYGQRLNEMQRKRSAGTELSEQDFSELNAFSMAGIPAADTLLGQIYLEGLGVPADAETALTHLNKAAARGDGEAFGYLGDYYYGWDNQKAFGLYSKPGAVALNEKRWQRFRNLHKVKRFNRLQLTLLLVLTAAVELFMFLFSNSAVTGGHMTACIVCTVINCLTVAGILTVHIKNPYQDLRNLSLPLLVSFFVFAQILI